MILSPKHKPVPTYLVSDAVEGHPPHGRLIPEHALRRRVDVENIDLVYVGLRNAVSRSILLMSSHPSDLLLGIVADIGHVDTVDAVAIEDLVGIGYARYSGIMHCLTL